MNVEFHPIPLAMITTVATHNHGYDNTYDYDYIFTHEHGYDYNRLCATIRRVQRDYSSLHTTIVIIRTACTHTRPRTLRSATLLHLNMVMTCDYNSV